MSQISATDVAKLRKITNAGMMDCKQALEESKGDFDLAIEFLRKKGQKLAAKREDREAKEGVVLAGVSSDSKFGCIVAINCETDFVAKNENFIEFTRSVLNKALDNKPNDMQALLNLQINGLEVSKLILDQIGKIGEKIELGYYETINAEKSFSYIHPGNKLAVVVGFNKSSADGEVGKNVAMQIAAMNPVSIDKDDCPQDIIKKEIEIGMEQARQEGKPEAMLEKIALGKLNKFYSESTLMNQDFIRDSKTIVGNYVRQSDKELKVTGFKRFSLS